MMRFGGLRPGARSPNQAFEQGCAGQAVGAMQAGARDLADGPQAIHSGSAVVVGGNAAAAVVRGGHHRDGFARQVDAALHAHGVDAGKTFAKLIGGLVRDVQINARLARFEHRLVDGARGDVTRRERAGGMEPLHEFLPVTIHQTAALAAYRLGNQEAAVGRQQRRRDGIGCTAC